MPREETVAGDPITLLHPPPPRGPRAPPLQPTGGYHAEQPLGKLAFGVTVRSEAAPAPQHHRPQDPLRHIVGWLDLLHSGNGPQRQPPPPQLTAQRRRLAVRVALPTRRYSSTSRQQAKG